MSGTSDQKDSGTLQLAWGASWNLTAWPLTGAACPCSSRRTCMHFLTRKYHRLLIEEGVSGHFRNLRTILKAICSTNSLAKARNVRCLPHFRLRLLVTLTAIYRSAAQIRRPMDVCEASARGPPWLSLASKHWQNYNVWRIYLPRTCN